MNRFLNFLMNSSASALLCVSGVVALAAFLVPPLREWAWLVGIGLVACAGVAVALSYRRYQTDQSRIDGLTAELSDERDTVRSITRELSEFKPLASEQDADVLQARSIVGVLDTREGLLQWLRVATQLTDWSVETLQPLTQFLDAHSRTAFDDPAVHSAFMDLYRSAQQLHDWFRVEGTAGDEGSVILTPGDSRSGGWRAYAEAHARGEQIADRFRADRAAFERIALERGALPTPR